MQTIQINLASGWGVSRPTAKGEVEGDLARRRVPAPGGCLLQGVPVPGDTCLGGWWRPPPTDSCCCGWYTSYWNAFLLQESIPVGCVLSATVAVGGSEVGVSVQRGVCLGELSQDALGQTPLWTE